MFTFCLLFLAVSFICVHWGRESFLKAWFTFPVERAMPDGVRVTVSGQVVKKEQTSEYQILYLRDPSIIYRGQEVQESQIILYEKSGKKFHLGNRVRAAGELSFFERERNPGGFSAQMYYHGRWIAAAVWSDEAECTDSISFPLRDRLDILKNRWKELFLTQAGEKDGGILSAMLLGDKREMDAEIKELYQVNGIAHILAISGLHLSFIGLSFYRLVRRVSGSFLLGGIVGMAFLLLYILMIGNSVSAIRAVIMFCIRVMADMSGRVYDGSTALAVAAVCVICWRPLAFYDAGFQLSFGAVAGMHLISPVLKENRRIKKKEKLENRNEKMAQAMREIREKEGEDRFRKRLRRLGESLVASLCVQLSTLPAVLYHFCEWPLYSVALNLVIIPLMSLLLTLGFAASFLGLLWPAAGGVWFAGCRMILWLYETLCRGTEYLPFRRIVTGRPELWGIALYGLCLTAGLLWLDGRNRVRCRSRGRKGRPERSGCEKSGSGRRQDPDGWRSAPPERGRLRGSRRAGRTCVGGVLLSAGVLVLLLACPGLNYRGLEVTFLDVGQGDGIFIRERGGFTCLIDGGSSDVSQVGKYRIEPFLKARGVSRVDYIFATHGDEDHVNGLEELMGRQDVGVAIGCLVLPPRMLWDEKLTSLCALAESQGIRTAVIAPGQQLTGREAALTCLGPDPERLTETGNAASLILSLTCGDLGILFTGDVEGEGEELLTEALSSGYEVLKVAHHGSKNSTGETFLSEASPELAVISAGVDNRYGHPHQELLDRLRRQGAAYLVTAESGAITLKQNGKEVANLRIIQYNKDYEKLE